MFKGITKINSIELSPPVVQPVDSFPGFYGIPRFITTFTRALHFSLS
jgi:hypothetical protein